MNDQTANMMKDVAVLEKERDEWKRVALEIREVLDGLCKLTGELCGTLEGVLIKARQGFLLNAEGIAVCQQALNKANGYVETMHVQCPEGWKEEA